MQRRDTPPSTSGSSHLGSGGGMSDTPSPRGVQREATICGGEQSSLRWRRCVSNHHLWKALEHTGQQTPQAAAPVCQIYLFLLNITPEHRSDSVHL